MMSGAWRKIPAEVETPCSLTFCLCDELLRAPENKMTGSADGLSFP